MEAGLHVSRFVTAARMCLSIIAALVALLFSVLAINAPGRLEEHGVDQQARLRSFEQVSAFVLNYHRQTGSFPSEDKIRNKFDTSARHTPHLALNVGVDGQLEDGGYRVGCEQEETFTRLESDAFVLSAWNGDSYDCYAYPSKRTNLTPVVKSSAGTIAKFAFIGLLFTLGAWLIWPTPRSSGT